MSRAHDRELDRDVAIKELIHRSDIGEARFLREALITARLEHPGIVPVHEAGRWPDGTPFYAMKLVAGRPLRDLIAKRHTVNERIALLHHVIAVADAIAYAHGRNIIHRDLKPGNVIVGDFGETVVIDWGLAKDLSTSDERGVSADSLRASPGDDLTNTGSILGTPAYMAPEQERGEDVDQRADVFAIGAMLWELCALQKVPPIEPRLRHRILRRGGIDRDLVTIIDKALARAPADRYADASALAADLKAFKAGARIAARDYSLPALLAHWTHHHRTLALGFVIVFTVGAIATTLYIQNIRAERDLTRNALLTAQHEQESHAARVLAEAKTTQAELEQGRAALLHGELADARLHLREAYRHGERSSGTEFMLARAEEPTKAELARLTSTSGRMWSAAFSPDGQQIVTTDDHNAQVWDAATGRRIHVLPHSGTVFHAVYSADGAWIVTACGDGAVRMWDPASGSLVREMKHEGKRPHYYAVSISGDRRFVAAVTTTGEATDVWSAESGTLLAELHNPNASDYPTLAFSADSRWLATGGGGDAQVVDTVGWKRTRAVGPRVRSLSFAPHGALLAVGTAGGDAAVWTIGGAGAVRHLRGTGESVDRIAWSPNGELVAAASRDGAEQVFEAASGAMRSQGNYLRGRIRSIEFDPTSRLVLAAGSSGAVVVADAAIGTPLAVLEGPQNVVTVAHFDPNARRVVGASFDGTARIWDATSSYRRWNSPPVSEECGVTTSLEPDRRFVAVGCEGHRTRVWDTARDLLLAELPGMPPLDGEFAPALPAVSGAGDRAAIARGTTVEVYGLPSGALLRTVNHGAKVTTVAFADHGRELLTGGADGSLIVSHDDGTEIELPLAAAGIDAATILRDGRIVSADARKNLRVYAPDGTLIVNLASPSRVGLMRRSADDRRLVTVPSYLAEAAPPALWDLERYRLSATLDGHVGRVWSARFVRDDREILTTGGDGTARSWDAKDGRLRATYRGGSRYLADATLAFDGSMIVAGGDDGLLRFWDATTARLLWTLSAHKAPLVAVHVEGADIVTRGFGGDVSRWTVPGVRGIVEQSAASAR